MKDILTLSRSDFNNYYGGELLSNLESCPDINFGTTINFQTNTRFDGTIGSQVMDAFNIYLRHLSRTVSRIIIT
jgi:hypothetical protein